MEEGRSLLKGCKGLAIHSLYHTQSLWGHYNVWKLYCTAEVAKKAILVFPLLILSLLVPEIGAHISGLRHLGILRSLNGVPGHLFLLLQLLLLLPGSLREFMPIASWLISSWRCLGGGCIRCWSVALWYRESRTSILSAGDLKYGFRKLQGKAGSLPSCTIIRLSATAALVFTWARVPKPLKETF
jgi:hypothetical protein